MKKRALTLSLLGSLSLASWTIEASATDSGNFTLVWDWFDADPVDPTDPMDPADPIDPGDGGNQMPDPVDPIDPGNGHAPGWSWFDTDPVDPTDPMDPVDPIDPGDGGNQMPDPVDPTDPGGLAPGWNWSIDPVYSFGPDDTLAVLISSAASLDDAVTFKAEASALHHNWEDTRTEELPGRVVSLKLFRTSPTAWPNLVIEAGGRQMTLGPEHVYDVHGNYYNPEEQIWANTHSGGWLAVANGFYLDEDGDIDPLSTRYHARFGLHISGARGFDHHGVFGIETFPDSVPGQGTAHFDGDAYILFQVVDDQRWADLQSEIHLTADFDAGMLHGNLFDREIWDPDTEMHEEFPGIAYELAPTAIDGNGFSTSLVADCGSDDGDCPPMPDSRVAGKFYGPYAAEAGGTIATGEFTWRGDTWVGVGSFGSANTGYSGPEDTLATLISSAASLDDAVAFKVDARRLLGNHVGGTTNAGLPDETLTLKLFRTSPTAVPTLVIETGDGHVTTFDPEHSDVRGNFDNGDGWAKLSATGDGWLELANGLEDQDFQAPFFFEKGPDFFGNKTRHVGVFGIETSPDDMPTRGTAYFDGYADIRSYRVDQFDDYRMFFDSDVLLTADFATGMVSGKLTDWDVWNAMTRTKEELPEFAYELVPAQIDGNGFSTSLIPDCDCPSMPDSQVAGKFYGPYAAEAGGTVATGEFTWKGETWLGIGGFRSSN